MGGCQTPARLALCRHFATLAETSAGTNRAATIRVALTAPSRSRLCCLAWLAAPVLIISFSADFLIFLGLFLSRGARTLRNFRHIRQIFPELPCAGCR